MYFQLWCRSRLRGGRRPRRRRLASRARRAAASARHIPPPRGRAPPHRRQQRLRHPPLRMRAVGTAAVAEAAAVPRQPSQHTPRQQYSPAAGASRRRPSRMHVMPKSAVSPGVAGGMSYGMTATSAAAAAAAATACHAQLCGPPGRHHCLQPLPRSEVLRRHLPERGLAGAHDRLHTGAGSPVTRRAAHRSHGCQLPYTQAGLRAGHATSSASAAHVLGGVGGATARPPSQHAWRCKAGTCSLNE